MIFAFIQRLIRDKSGVGFIELALVAPILALMFLGMVDLSRIVATRIDLEQAAQRTTDFALAKRPPNGSTTYLVEEAKTAAGVSASDVTVRLTLECDGTVQTNFTSDCAAGQETRRFATVAIRKTIDTGFNWRGMASIFTGRSSAYVPITVVGDSVVRLQ